MTSMLAGSYAHCRRIARRSASNFYYSFLLLPKPKRMAMCALYAFLRRTDDLGDGDHLGQEAGVSTRRAALDAWRQALLRAMEGRFDDPLLPALADTVQTFGVSIDHLQDVIDGVAMDLEPRTYATFDELRQYCHRVASAVGLACLRIWGCQPRWNESAAKDCGVAFQMTNILRDLKEDLARGRIYLPLEDFQRFDYTVDDLRAGVRDERFRRLMRFQIERTERLYHEGAKIESWLEPDGLRVFGSMMTVYRALLDEMKRLDGDVLSTRVRIGSWRRMRIATQWFLFGSRMTLPAASAAP